MRVRNGLALVLTCASAAGLAAYWSLSSSEPHGELLPTGKYISAIGTSTDVGSYPCNLAISPDGKYVAVTNTGSRQQLSILDANTGALLDKADYNASSNGETLALYYGLAFDPKGDLFASTGPLDRIAHYRLESNGKLKKLGDFDDPSGVKDEPHFLAGIAVGGQGRKLYVAHNEAYRSTGMRSSLSILDVATNKVERKISLPGFPLAVVALANGKIYASCEKDGFVAAIDAESGAVRLVKTGTQPTGLLLDSSNRRLFVSNSGSDTVSVIDTATDKILRTILTRPAALRGLPGSTPLGLALSDDEDRLFVALGDMNAVGVIDLKRGALIGYIPAGWYPTAVARSGRTLFVANAKGLRGKNPNGIPMKGDDSYVQNVIEGTVSRIDVVQALAELEKNTQTVLEGNFAVDSLARKRAKDFRNPGIKHVVYVIKENRTYDQVLGDMPQGNGDPRLLMFGKEVTPNQHALAERFVLLDNFNVCGEVSADGWQWATAGMASEYASRNVPFNYSGRGRSYDMEGQTNGVTTDYAGENDVAEVPGGHLWDACARQRVSFRNYGFYVDPIEKKDADAGHLEDADNAPTKKALLSATDTSYRRFDMHYADSELWNRYQSPEPKQLKKFGKRGSTSRFAEWKSEFDQMVASGKMPRLMMVQFCRDHTAGTTEGLGTPSAMVADNDYAVGQLVEAISKSPFWKDTAIFIIEDDAQNGQDHVDCHRSIGMVVSPFVKRSFVDSRFYNTDSFLRTMELLLGLKPMNQYDAVANTLDVFDRKALNAEPYTAMQPSRQVATAVNTARAYRAKDSERLISRFGESDYADLQLNDILWHSVKARK